MKQRLIYANEKSGVTPYSKGDSSKFNVNDIFAFFDGEAGRIKILKKEYPSGKAVGWVSLLWSSGFDNSWEDFDTAIRTREVYRFSGKDAQKEFFGWALNITGKVQC